MKKAINKQKIRKNSNAQNATGYSQTWQILKPTKSLTRSVKRKKRILNVKSADKISKTGSAMLNTCVLIFKKDLSDCHKLKNFSAAAPVTEFGRKEDLKKHERTHRNQSEPRNERNEQRMTNPKQFSCDECEMKFKTERDLQSQEKRYTCPHYKRARCMFGPKGKNEKGSCRYSHPRSVRRCIYDQTKGCKKQTVNSSMQKLVWRAIQIHGLWIKVSIKVTKIWAQTIMWLF